MHVFYPSAPNGAAGRYQAALDLTMDRRAYRASGQDETRNVREWNVARAASFALPGRGPVGERVRAQAGIRDAAVSRTFWDTYYSGRESSADEGRGL